MRRKVTVVFILLVLSLAGTARANDYEVWTHFFNCSMGIVGGNLRECDNDYTWWNQQTGAFKAVERWECNGSHTYTEWFQWTSSGWVQLEEAPEGC